MEPKLNFSSSTITTKTPIPKLSLNFSVPISQASEPAGSASPPHRTSASVPFLWEEAPGKPSRQWCSGVETEEITSKSLGLPPRLLAAAAEVRITNMPSPTTVLDGPDVGRSMSFSFRSPGRANIGYFGSTRWGSFRKAKASSGGSFDISSALDETGNDAVSSGGGGEQNDDHDRRDVEKVKKMAKARRSGSFLALSNKSSSHNLLASIYESFKQVVPWRRKQEKQRKLGS